LFHGILTGDNGDPLVILEFLVDETLLLGCNLVKIRGHVAKSSLTRPIILSEKETSFRRRENKLINDSAK
jgi:hypothetical protein